MFSVYFADICQLSIFLQQTSGQTLEVLAEERSWRLGIFQFSYSVELRCKSQLINFNVKIKAPFNTVDLSVSSSIIAMCPPPKKIFHGKKFKERANILVKQRAFKMISSVWRFLLVLYG